MHSFLSFFLRRSVGAQRPLSIFTVLLFTFSSIRCNKFVDIDPPINQVTAASVFADDANATAAVAGLYTQLMVSNVFFASGAFSVYAGLSADEIIRTTPVAEIDAFANHALTPSNSIQASVFWNRGYSLIYHVNACLEGLEKATALTPSVRQQLRGECFFWRAYCHFYLINLYGDIPLLSTTDYEVNSVAGRSSRAQVYQQIDQDLAQATQFLVPDYPTAGRVRVNLWAAMALTARVRLFEARWSEAETAASAVMTSGTYQLEPDLNKVFLMASREIILQLMPVLANVNTAEGLTFIPPPTSPSVKPIYQLTPRLLQAFEPGDNRSAAWVGVRTISGVSYRYPLKYKTRLSQGTPVQEYNGLLRLAEGYLIRAEARARMGNTAGALSDLNVIRSRAGLAAVTTTDPAVLLAAIQHEKQIELFAEQGHRWLDLKRWGLATSVLGFKPGFQATDTLYPLPLTDLQRNPNLFQNPGY